MKTLQKHIRIDLLRHGETVAGSCFLGSTDAGLNDAGWQQMHSAIKDKKYQRIISSPLKRCAEFSQQFSQRNNIPLVVETGLCEMHFGDWEVKSVETIWKEQQDLLSAFWEDPLKNAPPNGEKLIDFQSRVNAAFNKIRNEYNEERILVVAHGGVIRQILATILSVPFKNIQQINIDYAGLSRLDCYAENVSLAFINQRIEKN